MNALLGLLAIAMARGAGAGQDGASDVCAWLADGTADCACADRSVNLARGASLDSPDGHEQDWCSGAREGCSDAWAADGSYDTYWDETDDRAQYRLRVRLGTEHARTQLAGMAIVGFGHMNFSPRTFLVTCDALRLLEATNAVYTDNRWEACFAPRNCSEIEILISEAYGASPAIRELLLFPAKTPEQVRASVAAAAARQEEHQARAAPSQHELLLPQNIGTSRCGHLAGQTLVCIGQGGGPEECGKLRLKHWECVRDESARGRQGVNGHRALNRHVVEYVPNVPKPTR